VDAQGIDTDRYRVVPRTLVFVRDGERVLLQRRAPDRRVFPGRLNGLGGHVEAGEELAAAARREVREEAGLELAELELAGLLHVTEPAAPTGVLVVVFTAAPADPAAAAAAPAHPSPEGELRWARLADLEPEALVPDLATLWPRLWPEGDKRRRPFLALGPVPAPEPGGLRFAEHEPLSTDPSERIAR
jgi:8-oxo-dGTP diphosphatase